jgi:DNA adenine methylase
MKKNLFEMFEDLDRQTEPEGSKDDRIVRAPFGYPGGKTKSVPNILKHLPYRSRYIEPFGGSGAVLLARHKSKLEVLNDKYLGVVAFYRCLRDEKKLYKLIELLELTIHSREDFVDSKNQWENTYDDVERAAKWYYMVNYSFSSLGRNFGRATSHKGIIAGKIRNKLKHFPAIHTRLRKVQIENQDWYDCVNDYDNHDTVFYLDPPYVDVYAGTFTHELPKDEHLKLLETIFKLKGFVAVSGYSNPLYETQPWDHRFSWESFVTIESCVYKGNNKECLEGKTKRQYAEEVLWIKEPH